MADNVPVGPTGGGPTSVESVAADEIAGAKYQRIKLTPGDNGVNDGDVSKSNPLPISQNYKTLDRGASPTPDIDSVAVQTFSAEIPCLGKSLIKIKGEASNATGTVPIRIWTKDANGNWEPSEKVTPANTGQQGGSGDVPAAVETNYYHLAPITYPVEGATGYIIETTEVPSDSASVSFFGETV